MYFGSNLDLHSTVILPNLQKPKKVVLDAANSMMLLIQELSSSQTLQSLQRMEGVMGRRGREVLPFLAA